MCMEQMTHFQLSFVKSSQEKLTLVKGIFLFIDVIIFKQIMADKLNKRPAKGILKNSSSFDHQDPPPNPKKSKETKWDEINIMKTLHPPGKDYGHMKIDEPKTPYNYVDPDKVDGVNPDELAERIRSGAAKPPKAMMSSDEDDSEEELSPEELKKKKEFERKRKEHYNEFQAMQLAKKLLEEEEEDDEDDDDVLEKKQKADSPTRGQSSSSGKH